MPPSSLSSPVHKMAHPQRQSSQDSDSIRKRVCKACDRCRLKKSKCDGSHPCSRCKADNAICVFGERKKSHDKVYPKGYVEMLEQQQSQLVSGLQEMYRRLRNGQKWDGAALSETNGQPLTHDILAALNLLEAKHDGSVDTEMFEDDVQKLQARLLAEGAGYVRRRGSFSSDSEHSQHDRTQSGSHGTPILNRPPSLFRESFQFSAPSSPHSMSPLAAVRPPFQPQYTSQSSQLTHSSPLTNDPQFYQAEWAFPDMSTHRSHTNIDNDAGNMNTSTYLRAQLAMQAAHIDQQMNLSGKMAGGEHGQHAPQQPQQPATWDASSLPFDSGMAGMGTWPAQQLMTAFATTLPHVPDVIASTEMDGTDIDLNQFIQVVT